MKHIKTILKVVALLILGSVVGLIIGLSLERVDISQLEEFMTSIQTFIASNGEWFQGGVIVLFLSPAIMFTKKGVDILKSEAYLNDEGELGIFADKKINMGSLLGQLYFIVSIIVFAMVIGKRNDGSLLELIFFILGVMIFTFLQIWVVNAVKSVDELKEGDPTSFSFQKKWLNSLDEAEKSKVHEAGYKVFAASNGMMLIALMGTFMAKIFFDASIGNIILIGTIWGIQTILFTVYSSKAE